jgi:hypothetical protein
VTSQCWSDCKQAAGMLETAAYQDLPAQTKPRVKLGGQNLAHDLSEEARGQACAHAMHGDLTP